jgi:hypothetical protein
MSKPNETGDQIVRMTIIATSSRAPDLSEVISRAEDDQGKGSKVTPVPMLPSEIVRIETAMFFAQVSDKTIRAWAAKDGIGRQASRHAPLQISLPALLMKADGDMQTLEVLRAGRRSNPIVAAYLDRAIDLLEEHRRRPLR